MDFSELKRAFIEKKDNFVEGISSMKKPDFKTMGITKKDATVQDRIIFLEGFERKKTASLLFFGAFFGFLGFVFAFIIGLMKFLNPLTSEYHRVFPSGYGYFPATVSEMVHDPRDPAGKCFFAFEFVGAFFIFQSWYPWALRNVYVGDDDTVCPGLSWMMFRQFVPPAGMMLVATVTTTPSAQATILDYFCIAIHLTGAVMLFAGYAMVEAWTLGWWWIDQNKVSKNCIEPKERKVRKWILNWIIFWYVLFCILQVVLLMPLDKFGGHNDHWETRKIQNPTVEQGDYMSQVILILIDTASGLVLYIKILSYASEVFCGLSLISSFMAIWWFCTERHADLRDELFQVQDSDKGNN